MVLGTRWLTPRQLARMVDGDCGTRPTVIVVLPPASTSACCLPSPSVNKANGWPLRSAFQGPRKINLLFDDGRGIDMIHRAANVSGCVVAGLMKQHGIEHDYGAGWSFGVYRMKSMH